MALVKNTALASMVCSVAVLSGCAARAAYEKPSYVSVNVEQAEVVDANTQPKKLVAIAIEQMATSDLDAATNSLNDALRLDYSNSNIQLLNGLNYHLKAVSGDQGAYEMARQGYLAAQTFDPTNWAASYYLGLLHLERKEYQEAKSKLGAYVLQNTNDAEALFYLAAASYLSGDPASSALFVARAKDVLATSGQDFAVNPQHISQLLAVSHAALGNQKEASEAFESYYSIEGDSPRAERIKNRISNWLSKSKNLESQVSADAEVAQGENKPDQTEQESIGLQSEANDMVAVDVVIVRTSDNTGDSRGINLLNGLQVQFGDKLNGLPGWQKNRTRMQDYVDPTSDISTNTITSIITVPALTYSLNIANSRAGQNRIMAQPTLVSRVGQTSEFFAGMEVSAAAVSGGAGDSISVEKEIGVRLAITPEISEDGTVLLAVNAERTFLTAPSSSIVFQYRLDTTKTQVNANVAMQFGQTLILSGLSETDVEKSDDGVPLLKDIPGVNLLFSQKNERETKNSVMILLTPRKASFVGRDQLDLVSSDPMDAQLFSTLFPEWGGLPSNSSNLFKGISQSEFYRSFQTADVPVTRWYQSGAHAQRLQHAISSIYES